MKYQPLKLEVASADKMVMQCDVVDVIARTSEDNIGILPRHEPLMTALAPCMVEIVVAGGRMKVLAIDDRLLAMTQGHIRILSHEVRLIEKTLLQEAHLEAHKLCHLRSEGGVTDGQVHRLHIPDAQVRAREKYQTSH